MVVIHMKRGLGILDCVRVIGHYPSGWPNLSAVFGVSIAVLLTSFFIAMARTNPPPVIALTTDMYSWFSWPNDCKAICNCVDGHLLDPSCTPLVTDNLTLVVEMPKARLKEAMYLWKPFSAPQVSYHRPWKGADSRQVYPRVGPWRWSLNNDNNESRSCAIPHEVFTPFFPTRCRQWLEVLKMIAHVDEATIAQLVHGIKRVI